MGGNLFTDLLMTAVITVYIVDVSGFTDAWRAALAKWLHLKALGPLKPFDCGKCMTWWTCLVYVLATGRFSLVAVLLCVLLSLLSVSIANALLLLREWLNRLIDLAMPKWK